VIAASIFDHPAIVLLIALVALIRWLIEKAKSSGQNSPAPPPPPAQPISRGGETRSEEDRIRKVLEALGQPPGTAPPKTSPRRRETVPKIFPKLPPLTTAPPPLPEMATPFPTPPPLPVEVSTFRPARRDSNFEVQDFTRQTSSEKPPESRRLPDSRIKLRTPQDLRSAIILREILGPPRSLQSQELV
jgi:hypothetical protein